MWELIVGFLFGIFFWRYWTHPRPRKVKPGLNSDITLPHHEELKLHHNTMSTNSQKVRACLGETGLKHRKIHHNLPYTGGWETKSAVYLTNANPEGTVPVLIHNGHPIYESHEQIVYIDQVLMPGGPRLTPTDPGKKALMDKWVESVLKIMSELLGGMSMPLVCAYILKNFTIWNILDTVYMIPLVTDYFFMQVTFWFRIFGVEAFTKVDKIGSLVSPVRNGINHHFALLSKDLEASAGPYICGKDYTLGDVSMVPIFERMEYARWWTDSLIAQFPLVKKYWDAIQQREGYQASKLDMEMHNKMVQVGKQIDQWKKTHKWFNDFYEN